MVRRQQLEQRLGGTSLVVQWLGLHASTAASTGSLPGRGTKIPHAAKKKKGTQIGSYCQLASTLRRSSSSKSMSLTPGERGLHPRRSRVLVSTRVQGNESPLCYPRDPTVIRRALWVPKEETIWTHLAWLLNVASLSWCHQISLGHRILTSFLQVDLLLGLARSILDFILVDCEQSLSTRELLRQAVGGGDPS